MLYYHMHGYIQKYAIQTRVFDKLINCAPSALERVRGWYIHTYIKINIYRPEDSEGSVAICYVLRDFVYNIYAHNLFWR